MDSLACEEMAPGPTLGLPPAATRPRQLAVVFQADNPRSGERPRKFEPRPAIAIPAYSRIVYRDGAVHVR
jgi:hypothetical protein